MIFQESETELRFIIFTASIISVFAFSREGFSSTSLNDLNAYLTGNYSSETEARKGAQRLLLEEPVVTNIGERQIIDWLTVERLDRENLNLMNSRISNLIATLENGLGPEVQKEPNKIRNLEILLLEMEAFIRQSALAIKDNQYMFKRRLGIGVVFLASLLVGAKYLGGYFYGVDGTPKVITSDVVTHLFNFGITLYLPATLTRAAFKAFLGKPSSRYPPPPISESQQSLINLINRARLQWCDDRLIELHGHGDLNLKNKSSP